MAKATPGVGAAFSLRTKGRFQAVADVGHQRRIDKIVADESSRPEITLGQPFFRRRHPRFPAGEFKNYGLMDIFVPAIGSRALLDRAPERAREAALARWRKRDRLAAVASRSASQIAEACSISLPTRTWVPVEGVIGRHAPCWIYLSNMALQLRITLPGQPIQTIRQGQIFHIIQRIDLLDPFTSSNKGCFIVQ
jgi:hypothetical protein